ncbi:hypothetical protein AB0876_09140 [Mycobacterium sp. NPDC049093]
MRARAAARPWSGAGANLGVGGVEAAAPTWAGVAAAGVAWVGAVWVAAAFVVAWADSAAMPGGSSGRDGSPGTARCRGGAVQDAAIAGREVRPRQ